MKYVAILIASALLSGCAYWSERDHGSWLDQVGKPVSPARAMADDEAGVLSSEIVRLRSEAESIRAKLASEKSRDRRMDYLRSLRDLGDQIHPRERALVDAGRSLPPQPQRGG